MINEIIIQVLKTLYWKASETRQARMTSAKIKMIQGTSQHLACGGGTQDALPMAQKSYLLYECFE